MGWTLQSPEELFDRESPAVPESDLGTSRVATVDEVSLVELETDKVRLTTHPYTASRHQPQFVSNPPDGTRFSAMTSRLLHDVFHSKLVKPSVLTCLRKRFS